MLRIAITLPGFVPGEASFIVRLLDESFDRVHIRKPDADTQAVAQLIEGVPKAYRSRLVLHEHHVLAERYGLGGIHLNYRNPVAPAGFQGEGVEATLRLRLSKSYLRQYFQAVVSVGLFQADLIKSQRRRHYRPAGRCPRRSVLPATGGSGAAGFWRLRHAGRSLEKDGVGAFSYFAAFMWRLRTIAHTPRAMSGMLNNWPMSSGRLASKASCTSLVNSMKKRKVNTSVRQRPK